MIWQNGGIELGWSRMRRKGTADVGRIYLPDAQNCHLSMQLVVAGRHTFRACARPAGAPKASCHAQPKRLLGASTFVERVLADFEQRTDYDEKADHWHAPLARELVSLADLSAGQHVLDVATGTGDLIR